MLAILRNGYMTNQVISHRRRDAPRINEGRPISAAPRSFPSVDPRTRYVSVPVLHRLS